VFKIDKKSIKVKQAVGFSAKAVQIVLRSFV